MVIERIRFFAAHFTVANDDAKVTDALLTLLQELEIGGKQVHDANIVATMLVNNVGVLLTHNVGDFTRYTHLIQIVALMDTLPS